MSRTPPAELLHSARHAEIRRGARAHFDRWARTYDRSWLNELVFYPTIRTCVAELERWRSARAAAGRPVENYRLLDVGCGTGTLICILAAQPEAELLVGLDYSPVMVRGLAEKISAAPAEGRLHAVQGDSERLPFAAATFDVVVCCNSMHHYPHQAAVVRGFRRVLRPGGLLILVDGFRDNTVGWVLFDVFVSKIEGGVHHAAWSEVRDMVRDAGFDAWRQRKLNVLAPLLVTTATVACPTVADAPPLQR